MPLSPLLRAASIASSRPRMHRQDRDEARDVEDPLHAGLDGVADADDEALRGLERAAPRVEQRAEDRGVHERRGGEVDDDAAAAAERLVEALAQRRRRVDVVLALDDDDDDVARRVVQHDRVGFHGARDRLPKPRGARYRLEPMGDRLGPYRAKRDFGATPEPPPAERRPARGARAALRRPGAPRALDALGPAARARGHARLVGRPEGHPARPERNHLAVRTEDHPLEYLEFEGDIPEG